MKKLLMLGTNNSSVEMVRCAKKMGVYTIVTDNLPVEKSLAKLEADEYWMISTADLDRLEETCRKEGVTAITCGVSEFNQDMAMELCDRLGLPNYADKEAWSYSRNKAKLKALCRELDIPTAKEYIISEAMTDEELDAVEFPVIVKPVDLCSNRGATFCENREELIEACRYARSVSKNSRIIVEQRLVGQGYLGMYALADGEISFAGLCVGFNQPNTSEFCYVISTNFHKYALRYFEEVNDYVIRLIKATGCKDGFAWVQLLQNNEDDVHYVIEFGHRMPGSNFVIPMETDNHFDTIKWMVECALGVKHTASDLPAPQTKITLNCAAAYMIWTKRAGTIAEVRGWDEVLQIPGVDGTNMCMYVGETVDPYRPIALLIFSSDTPKQMCEMVDMINQKLSVLDTEGNEMIIHFTNFDYILESHKACFLDS